MEDQQQGENGQKPHGQNPNGQNANGQNPRGESPGNHTHNASMVHYQMNNASGSAEFDDNFPPGYRFKPLDKELMIHYLRRKILNEPLPPNRIEEVHLYGFNPETLAEKHKPLGPNEWYFFSPRDRKYKRGKRPNRAAGDGFWKATGADKPIKNSNVVLGFKKTLVFYVGKPPKGDKTGWIMHEFRLEGPPRIRSSTDDMRLDDWVLCRIYKKKNQDRSRLMSSRPSTSSQRGDSGLDDDTEFQDNGANDIGFEGSTLLPKESFMPRGPGGSGVIEMSGYSNQRGFFNSCNYTFLYHQNQFGNHKVPYSEGRIPRLPNHSVPYGMPNHNIPYSQGRLIPGMVIHSVLDSQGRLPGIAPLSYNNPMGQSNGWPYHMIPTPNKNPNQVAESSSSAARPFQAYPEHHIFATSNPNSNQSAESSSSAARPFQYMESSMNEYQLAEFLNDPSDDNCFDPDDHNWWKF